MWMSSHHAHHTFADSSTLMNSDSLNSYLEAQVLTATPQKQRLMLIEGAMRFMRQAVQAWEDDQYEQASAALSSSRKIVAELISSIRIQEGELTQRVAAIYVFVFQTIKHILNFFRFPYYALSAR